MGGTGHMTPCGREQDYQQQADRLLESQKEDWPLLRGNWNKLSAARIRAFSFDGFTIKVQYNPERITSSAAKVDKHSIEKRACFLCAANRPPEQGRVLFGGRYEILCNPFPIFSRHYTIARPDHTPQVIGPEFGGMLALSRALPGLVVFYNAPNCGASAPDHMHFQAGGRGFMPLEDELPGVCSRYGRMLIDKEQMRVLGVNDGLRRFVLMESPEHGALEEVFELVLSWTTRGRREEEPMLNILAWYSKGWQVLVFPREKHRPWQYFEKGEKNILLSPASVDMGGMLITPLEKDFDKIGRDDIIDIFSQVCLSKSQLSDLEDHILKNTSYENKQGT